MSDVAFFDTIKDRIAELWAETPVHWPNEQFDEPEPPAPWLLVEMSGDVFGQASIGAGRRRDNLWREGGSLWLHIMVPVGTGEREARRLLREAVDLFVGQEVGDITFGDASIGMGQPGDENGLWHRLSASIDWTRDE
ncbi:hypothetical protein HMPREF9946_02229 [Acetobacteraceae bacterium AT-5844]|nr:hypothetical protein HMPREF9946_02229 [Acetobacteraceae bacterium AT-5844]